MEKDRNREIALRFFRLLQGGKFDEALALFADDAVCWDPIYGNYSARGFMEGAEKFLAHTQGESKRSIHSVTAEEDRVALETELYAPLKNGKTYHNTYHFLFQMEGGKIKLLKEYHNTKHQSEILESLAFTHSGAVE